MRRRKKRSLYYLLLLLFVIIGIGYAVLNATLTINGTSGISTINWNVHFATLNVVNGSVPINTTAYASASAATIDPNDTTRVSYNVLLSQPGDFYEFTVKAVNSGSIDAMVGTVTSTIKVDDVVQNNIPAWLDYSATYYDGTAISQNDALDSGDEELYRVRLEFKRDITNAQFDQAVGKTVSVDFEVTYIQKTGSANVVTHSVYTVNVYDAQVEGYNNTRLGEAIAGTIPEYYTPRDAFAAYAANVSDSTIHYALKHHIEDGVIQRSYVVFEITSAMVATHPGMTAGVYALQGGVNETSLNSEDRTVFQTNMATLQTALGNGYCSLNGENYNCTVADANFRADVGYSGNVDTGSCNAWYCIIYTNGESKCNHW